MLPPQAIAGVVFLVLYLLISCVCLWLILSKRVRLKSRFLMLFIHSTIRVAAQVTAIVSGMNSNNTDWIVAYSIMAFEGFASLLICCFRFIVAFHRQVMGGTWISPTISEGMTKTQWFRANFLHASFFCVELITAANIMILVSSINIYDERAGPVKTKWIALLTTGNALALVIVALLLAASLATYLQARRFGNGKECEYFALALLACAPFLIIRGVYGILSALITPFNFIEPSNYPGKDFKSTLVISEYCMGTATEWITCSILLGTYLIHLPGLPVTEDDIRPGVPHSLIELTYLGLKYGYSRYRKVYKNPPRELGHDEEEVEEKS